MRERLIVAFVALAVGIIALFGIPRAYYVAEVIHTAEERRVVRLAEFSAILLEDHAQDGGITAEFLGTLVDDGEHIVYTAPDGTRVQAGADAAAGDITSTVELADGASVTYARTGEAVAERVQEAVMSVLLIGMVLMVVAAVAGYILARRLSRPFVRLAAVARDLGDGNLASEPADLRIPEARAIDTALRQSASTLEARIRREHEFAANASHQLRTPVTALRLELEDLSLWPETPPTVREQLEHALREIDRLTEAITELLELARGGTPGADAWVPLPALIEQAQERWSAQASSRARRITIDAASVSRLQAPAPTSQILDVLVHNALQHGRGTVRITATRGTGYATVSVADEGPRPHGNGIFQRRPNKSTGGGEGIGLALAAELAEALGGHLLLDSSAKTRFSLIVTSREESESSAAAAAGTAARHAGR